MDFGSLAVFGAGELNTAFSTALDTIKGDVMGYVAVALPVALTIVGAFFGIRKGISFFKSVAK